MSKGNYNKSSSTDVYLNRIIEGIFQIRIPLINVNVADLGHVNCYLIKGVSGWVLLDCGWYDVNTFKILKKSLKNINLELSDITHIVLTHSHPDHYGVASKIKQLFPKTQIFYHALEFCLIQSKRTELSNFKDISNLLSLHGVPEKNLNSMDFASIPTVKNDKKPDHIFYGGEIIHTGVFDLEVIWTPGHSPGHICMYEQKNKLLFSGDHILPTITPNVSYMPFSGDNPLGNYLCSLIKLSNIPIRLVLPGHEYPFSELKDRIIAIIHHHCERESEIQNIIKNNYFNSYEIAQQLTWNVNLAWDEFPPLLKRAAITETIAHLEHMRWKGKIKRIFNENHFVYHL